MRLLGADVSAAGRQCASCNLLPAGIKPPFPDMSNGRAVQLHTIVEYILHKASKQSISSRLHPMQLSRLLERTLKCNNRALSVALMPAHGRAVVPWGADAEDSSFIGMICMLRVWSRDGPGWLLLAIFDIASQHNSFMQHSSWCRRLIAADRFSKPDWSEGCRAWEVVWHAPLSRWA